MSVKKILDVIQNIFFNLIEFIKKNIKIFTIIGAVIILAIIGGIFLIIRKESMKNSPIQKIEATCDYSFKTDENLADNLEYFDIQATHENGVVTTISSDADISLSQKYVNPYGEESIIKLTYTDDDGSEYSCNVSIPNEREKIVGFQCGYPDVKKVIAVLYSNGELAFEGEGDTLVYYEGEYPWLKAWWEDADIGKENAVDIKSVTFQNTVKPTNLNYAFEDCTSLVFIDKIPSSVRTMVRTFANCTSLTKAADVSNADNLLNMNGTYAGDAALIDANIIPSNVRVAKGCFKDCTSLQLCADMSKADNLKIIDSMYENCQSLSIAKLRDGIISTNNTFSECINLKQVSDFPTTIKYMDGTFSGAVSLTRFDAIIPESVQSLTECFKSCELLSGEIHIDCNTDKFTDMFLGACQATKINLIGDSMLLDAYANTNDMLNVYVNGIRANSAITSYADVFEQ